MYVQHGKYLQHYNVVIIIIIIIKYSIVYITTI